VKRTVGTITAALSLAGFVGIAGIAGTVGTAAAGPVRITLYSGQHPQTTAALVTAFEKATGIVVAERDNDEDAIASQIMQEGSRSPADVVLTENSPVLEYLGEHGRLAKVTPSTLAEVPTKYNSPKGQWVGVSARVNVIVYNTRLIHPSQLPTSIMGLANSKWDGRIGLAPSETDFQPIVTSVDAVHGRSATVRWLEALRSEAGRNTYQDNETLVQKVNSGAVAFGVMNQYYWYRMAAEVGRGNVHSAIAYFAPHDPGYVLDVSGAGVLSSSTHQSAAQRFVAFLVSRQGQAIIAKSDSFEYPIGSGVKTAKPETPLAALRPAPLTIGQLGDGQLAISLLQQAGLT
jgi:iron(III) transport system substrate-binding protein